MKVNGVSLDGPKEVLVVIPRGETDLAFKFRAVLDIDEFEEMCPRPSPPRVSKPGGEIYFNTQDKTFLQALDEYSTRQGSWQFLKSISATDGLEWSRVKLDDPGTWNEWQAELKEAGFSIAEKNALWSGFVEANSLSPSMLDEARKRFLASQQAKEESLLFQMDVVSSSLSSEPVNVSVSDQRELERGGKI